MSYRDNFDHLGEPRSNADFHIADLAICCIAFAVISALMSGVLV